MSDTHPADPREYVLGTDDVELERLGLQASLWADHAAKLWHRARIGPGQSVLDVGCGPGFASVHLARMVGASGKLVGVDQSERYLDYAQSEADRLGMPWWTVHHGQVTELPAVVPADAGPFDAAYVRWVLCFVDDVAAVARGLAEVVKPGGRVLIQDYFNYHAMTIAPKDPRWDRFRDQVIAAWEAPGGDSDVMGRMPGVLRDAGFEIDHLDISARVVRGGDTMWTWPSIFWASFIPRMVEGGFMTQPEADEINTLWREVAADPGRFFVLPQIYELIAVRRP
ncbi:MAG: methyltransferase domain-containing protein [Planctomycetota bacterium]